jgi:hypothetical protein
MAKVILIPCGASKKFESFLPANYIQVLFRYSPAYAEKLGGDKGMTEMKWRFIGEAVMPSWKIQKGKY